MYDVAIIGGGHNGLMASMILAKKGYKTIVLEQGEEIGGLCATVDIPGFPGYKMNVGAVAPATIRINPIWQEFDIENKYGLEYVNLDPGFTYFFPDGKYWHLYNDLMGKDYEQIKELAGERDAEAWREFIATYAPVFELIGALMFSPAVSMESMLELAGDMEGDISELLRTMLMPLNATLAEWFDSDYVKGPILKVGGSFGNYAREGGTGIWGSEIILMTNESRPVGGAGQVPRALAACAKDNGAEIRTNAAVAEVLIEDGVAKGVKLADGEEIAARCVIAASDPKALFKKLVPADQLEEKFRRRINALQTQNSCGISAHYILSEAPDFTATYPGIDNDVAIASNMVWCPSQEYNDKWQADLASGRVPENPVFWAELPTSTDSTLAPEGKHILTIIAFSPEKMTREEEEQYADACFKTFAKMAPNVENAVIGRYVEGPIELAARSGGTSGSFYHIDQSLSQLLMFRPLPELANGTTPIKNLFLGGQGVWPLAMVAGCGALNSANLVEEALSE